ncbi:alpha/beta fold hydrolase [Nocardiopsis oceani]
MEGGAGTPVFILPGAGLNTATLLEAVRVLSEDRPVLVADLPGHPGLNDGTRPARPRMATYGDWLDETLPQATGQPVILLGSGAGAATALCSTPSPLIRGICLVNPAGLVSAGPGTGLMGAFLRWRLDPAAESSASMLRLLGFPSMTEPGHAVFVEWMTLVARSCRVRALLPPRPLRSGVYQRWEGVPTSVATGSEDPLFSPYLLDSPTRLFLNTRVQTLHGSGHLALRDRPDRIRELLRGFPATVG